MNRGWLKLVLIMRRLQCSPIGMLAYRVRGYSQCVIPFRMWPVNLSVPLFFSRNKASQASFFKSKLYTQLGVLESQCFKKRLKDRSLISSLVVKGAPVVPKIAFLKG